MQLGITSDTSCVARVGRLAFPWTRPGAGFNQALVEQTRLWASSGIPQFEDPGAECTHPSGRLPHVALLESIYISIFHAGRGVWISPWWLGEAACRRASAQAGNSQTAVTLQLPMFLAALTRFGNPLYGDWKDQAKQERRDWQW